MLQYEATIGQNLFTKHLVKYLILNNKGSTYIHALYWLYMTGQIPFWSNHIGCSGMSIKTKVLKKYHIILVELFEATIWGVLVYLSENGFNISCTKGNIFQWYIFVSIVMNLLLLLIIILRKYSSLKTFGGWRNLTLGCRSYVLIFC